MTHPNEPAYPPHVDAALAMSTRQWFAAHALVGYLSRSAGVAVDPQHVADLCYRMADAMIDGGRK